MIFYVLLVLSTTKLKNNIIDSSPSKQQKLTSGSEIIKTTFKNEYQTDKKNIENRTKFMLQTYTSPQHTTYLVKGFVKNQVERYNKISIKNECSMNMAIKHGETQKYDEKLDALSNKQLLSKHKYATLGPDAYTNPSLYIQKLNAIAKRRKTEKENFFIFKKHEEAIGNPSSKDPYNLAYRSNNNTGRCKGNLIDINSRLIFHKNDSRYISCNKLENKEAVNSKISTFKPKVVVSKFCMQQPLNYKSTKNKLMNEKNCNRYENLGVMKTKKFKDDGRDELKQFEAVYYEYPIITLKDISSNLYKRRIFKYESRKNQSTFDTTQIEHENTFNPKINRIMDYANRIVSKQIKTSKNDISKTTLGRNSSKLYERRTLEKKKFKNDTSIIKNYFTYDYAINPKNDGTIDYSYQNKVLQFEKIRENVPKIKLNEKYSNLYQRRRLKSKSQNNKAMIRKNSADEKNSIEISSSAHFIYKSSYGTILHIHEDDDLETKDVTIQNGEENFKSELFRKKNKDFDNSKKTLLNKFFALFTCINNHEPQNDNKKEKLQ